MEWIEELYKEMIALRFPVTKKLFSGQSDFQKVEVVETKAHGKLLLNDGCTMVSERDEFIYHEMIVHVPMFAHPNPKRVLIIGGGDGGTAREVLRHPTLEKCVMVEIDKMVVDACKEHIPLTAACLTDPKLELYIEDGVKYLAETKEKFDVIMIDSTDPVGPAAPLFGPEFYGNVKRALNPGGIVSAQGESPFYEPEAQASILKIASQLFSITTFYQFTNMTYPGGYWSFMYASNDVHPLKNFDAKRIQASGLKMKYYNSEIHKACFAWPNFMLEKLKAYRQGFDSL